MRVGAISLISPTGTWSWANKESGFLLFASDAQGQAVIAFTNSMKKGAASRGPGDASG